MVGFAPECASVEAVTVPALGGSSEFGGEAQSGDLSFLHGEADAVALGLECGDGDVVAFGDGVGGGDDGLADALVVEWRAGAGGECDGLVGWHVRSIADGCEEGIDGGNIWVTIGI